MINLNVNQICSINVFLKQKVFFYEYRNIVKLFGFTIRKEGFYDIFDDTYQKNINDNTMFTENNEVFYYPYIEIIMSNNSKYKKFFNSKKELEIYLEFYNDLNHIKWITIQ